MKPVEKCKSFEEGWRVPTSCASLVWTLDQAGISQGLLTVFEGRAHQMTLC